MLRPTVAAIPIFALLIAAEAHLSRLRGTNEFEDRNDTRTNIILGFSSTLWGIVWGLLAGFIYLTAYEFAPYRFPPEAWWTWVTLFFVDDLAYYVFHRVSHECRLFWNFHVVHHSSKQFNLSVAVRQSWFSGMIHWIFYAPVMLLGFAPWMFLVVHGFNLIYQFWVHTKLIRSLGPLEWVLNSPSHHRVHHGVNNLYLDKNYAGVLIIWDRLFGSFVKETEEPRYGIVKQLDSYNPFWINTHGWVEMRGAIRAQPNVWRKMRCVFGSPNMDLGEAARKPITTN